MLEKKEDCNDCWAKNLCGGNCSHSNLLLTGSPLKSDENECAFIRYIAKQAILLSSKYETNTLITSTSNQQTNFKLKVDSKYQIFENILFLDTESGYTIAELEYSWKDIIESIPKSTFFNAQNIATLTNSNIHLTQKVLNELVSSNMLEVV